MDTKKHETEKWIHLRTKYRIMEYIGIIAIIVCVIVGIVSDIFVSKGNVWHIIEDINSFSLTLLQIQASISTLTIALVALISGSISDEYMGVSISDYYLNIRPVILKQKIIILGAVGLLFVNVALHQWKLYNLVICLFWATGILILLSVIELYALFRGKSAVMQEIEDYIIYILNSSHKYEKKKDIFHAFVQCWVTQAVKQSQNEYEKYTSIFKASLDCLIEYRNTQCIQDIESDCIKISHCFLSENNVSCNQKGFIFIQDIYEKMWLFVRDNNLRDLELETRFNVFSQVLPEWQKAMDKMAISEIERCLKWKYLSDDIARVAIEFNYEADTNDTIGELESVIDFSRYIGYYLKKRQNVQSEQDNINHVYWGDFLKNMYFSTYNVSDSGEKVYLSHKIKLYFSYFYGLVINDFGFIVKEYFYFDTMANGYLYNDSCYNLLCLMIHSYLYYLSEKESDACVNEGVRESAKKIIKDAKVKNIFKYFLYRGFSECRHLGEVDVEKVIYDVISRYELFPKYASAKTMIMQDVVKEFYVFIILYVKNVYYTQNILTMLKSEMSSYYTHFLGEKESRTKAIFLNLYTLIEDKKTQEEVNREIDLMYNQLNTYVTKQYKQKVILEAEKKQKEYIETVDKEVVIAKIKEQVFEHINEVFEPMIDRKLPQKNVLKFHLLRCIHYTDNIESEKINGYFSSMDGVLVDNLVASLLQRRVISEKNKEDFSDDIAYIQLLKENNIKLLIGSEFILKNADYKNKRVFDEFAENCNCIFTGYTNSGLALMESGVKFSIKDVNVSIHPMTFEESNPKYESSEGKYLYELRGGVPAYFDRDELETYIHNERKILDISIKATFSIMGKDLGYVFYKE